LTTVSGIVDFLFELMSMSEDLPRVLDHAGLQLPISRSHEPIGGSTFADGMLDPFVQNAHHIEMRGDSIKGIAESQTHRRSLGGRFSRGSS
jgi:hypothetical protein